MLIPDYTLLAPGTAHEMLNDVITLAAWIRTELNGSLQSIGVPPVMSPDFAVIGQSAGGYLTYLMVIQIPSED